MEEATEQANELISLLRSERAAKRFGFELFNYQADLLNAEASFPPVSATGEAQPRIVEAPIRLQG